MKYGSFICNNLYSKPLTSRPEFLTTVEHRASTDRDQKRRPPHCVGSSPSSADFQLCDFSRSLNLSVHQWLWVQNGTHDRTCHMGLYENKIRCYMSVLKWCLVDNKCSVSAFVSPTTPLPACRILFFWLLFPPAHGGHLPPANPCQLFQAGGLSGGGTVRCKFRAASLSLWLDIVQWRPPSRMLPSKVPRTFSPGPGRHGGLPRHRGAHPHPCQMGDRALALQGWASSVLWARAIWDQAGQLAWRALQST